jgi:hypothetical protein
VRVRLGVGVDLVAVAVAADVTARMRRAIGTPAAERPFAAISEIPCSVSSRASACAVAP